MSFNTVGDGIPFVKVKGGMRDGKIIYLSDKEGGLKSIKLSGEEKFQPIPNTKKERTIHYITGRSGSGKSTYAFNFLKEYKKKYKDNPIYLFSRLGEDSSIDKIEPLRVNLGENLLEEPIDTQELKNSCCIFDDIDTLNDKDIKKVVENIRDDILETGRHHNITCLITNHLATGNGRDLRRTLNESQYMVFFPQNWDRGLKYLIDNYMGIDKKQFKKIKASKSRWCCFHKDYPNAVILEKEIFIPDVDFD